MSQMNVMFLVTEKELIGKFAIVAAAMSSDEWITPEAVAEFPMLQWFFRMSKRNISIFRGRFKGTTRGRLKLA